MARYERVCPEDEAWDKFFEEIGALPIEEARARWDSQPDLRAACDQALEQLRIDHEARELTGGCGNHPLMETLYAALAKARP